MRYVGSRESDQVMSTGQDKVGSTLYRVVAHRCRPTLESTLHSARICDYFATPLWTTRQFILAHLHPLIFLRSTVIIENSIPIFTELILTISSSLRCS